MKIYSRLQEIVLVALLATIASSTPGSAQQPKSGLKVVSIEETHGSGMCIGYCIFELRITGTRVRYRERAFPQNRKFIPDKQVKANITKEEWDHLIATIDIADFKALPDRIGCPGCVDEVVQSIEIKFSDGSKNSIFYNSGGQPVSLSGLVEKIDSLESGLREKMKHKYPNPEHFPNPD